MKKTLFLLIIFIITLNSCSQSSSQKNEVTTYYFIRHAEKDRTDESNKNPHLTATGNLRAENWRTVFSNINFDMVFSTNFNRTIQTATPTAESKDLEIQFYNPKELFNKDFQLKTKGKTVLVVGHSNTTPEFVNKVLGTEKYHDIDDNNNSNLYIITVSDNLKKDILLVIKN
jgi:2,3-bisphosphoglycerate-dependent phosphoglycerate mutase